jgi:patched 1 protein
VHTSRIIESSTINVDAFYNYLTAWYNVENVMYHMSQAAFLPLPPVWTPPFRHASKQRTCCAVVTYVLLLSAAVVASLIPAATALIHARIPLFLTNLTHTALIVDMIKVWRGVHSILWCHHTQNIRNTCDSYATLHDVYAFPSGVPFTFWEQYLHLRKHLLFSLLVTITAVFVIVSVLLMSLWTAAIVVGTLLIIVVELAGFMGMCV